MSKGQARVRADLAAAAPAVPSSAHGEGGGPGDRPPPEPPRHLTGRFKVAEDGLWQDRADDKPALWVSSPVWPVAETTDDDGFFGMLWAWRDRNGLDRQEVFAREQFSGEAGELRNAMAARGMTFNASREARQAVAEYINVASSAERARVVYRTGWHDIGGRRIYVMPDGAVMGNPPMRVVLQTVARDANIFQQSGSLADWRGSIGAACIGNSRLCLSVCMPFAAALIYPVGEDGGGINLVGDSRSGKTTCGLASASVCGGDPLNGGARAAVRTWRGTSNGTEAIAAVHSDTGLIMDELGQADAKDVGQTQYMLAGGQGKARLDRGSALRSVLRFRVFYLSTGEVTLASKMLEAGIKAKAGQGVRLVDLPADEGRGMGAFADIGEADSPGAFAQSIKEAAARFYGTPFRAFIARIVAQHERDPDFADRLRRDVDRITSTWLLPFGAHGGQVRSVARRFALIALAGNLATEYGITGWGVEPTGEREAEWASHTCFKAWLANRGTIGSHEDAQAVIALRAFVSLHGGSRFDDWGDRPVVEGQQIDVDAPPPQQKFRTVNRAGWRKWSVPALGMDERHASWHYFITVTAMHEVLTGLDYKASLALLVKRGLILPGTKEIAKSIRVPGNEKQRLYEVPASVMSAELDDISGSAYDPPEDDLTT